MLVLACWQLRVPLLGNQACPGAAEAEQSEKFLLSARTVKSFFSLQLISLGWGREKERERLGGEGGLLDMLDPL